MDKERKKLQKELRDVERLSLISKEAQESIKQSLKHQLQEVEKRRHDFMLEHQKVQKRSQKIQSLQDKRRNLQNDSVAANKEMRKTREEIDKKEERFRLLSDKVDKNRTADAEMEAELQGLQAGERRGSNASQALDCCLETMVEQIFALGADQTRSKFEVMCQMFFRRIETRLRRCQEEMKEGTVKMNKSKAEQISSWCSQRQAGSMKALQRVVWSLIFLVFGVHIVNAEEQENQVHRGIAREVYPTLQVDVQWKRMHSRETCECKWDEEDFRKKRKEKKTARVRTQELLETQSKGGEFKKSRRKKMENNLLISESTASLTTKLTRTSSTCTTLQNKFGSLS